MQELYRRVRKPRTVNALIQLIPSGEYRRDSYMQELYHKVHKPRAVNAFIQLILSGEYRRDSYPGIVMKGA